MYGSRAVPGAGRLSLLLLLFLLAGALEAATVPLQGDPQLRHQADCPSCLEDFLGRLEGSFQLLPGVNISAARNLPGPSSNSSSGLAATLDRFLRSVTLHVAVYNEPVLTALQTVVDSSEVSETGRAKKKRKRFQFLSVYTVFAIAFALLSALVGKALTISIVSLVVTLLVSRAVRNDLANNSPIYDIVRRPQVQVQHTHSAEEVYEIPTANGPGNTVSYVYASAPLRGRNVADPYSPYAPNAVHVSSIPAGSDSGIKHEHISE